MRMNKPIWLLSVLATASAPTLALAGPGGTTCVTAEVIFPSTTYTGDTSAPGYGNPVGGFGPLPSPSNDAIYKFTGPHSDVEVTAAGYNYGIFLTTNCTGTTNPPLQAATGPAPGGMLLLGKLTDGQQYFVIMSGNPSDPSAPNGSFTFTDPFIGVELQTFSID